ncbi:hypothetical protein AHF37_00800 [Paragonimus kellicotti]|nr:hypothetical protein AHF37_00800 [Paragonimus kellicotti]
MVTHADLTYPNFTGLEQVSHRNCKNATEQSSTWEQAQTVKFLINNHVLPSVVELKTLNWTKAAAIPMVVRTARTALKNNEHQLQQTLEVLEIAMSGCVNETPELNEIMKNMPLYVGYFSAVYNFYAIFQSLLKPKSLGEYEMVTG